LSEIANDLARLELEEDCGGGGSATADTGVVGQAVEEDEEDPMVEKCPICMLALDDDDDDDDDDERDMIRRLACGHRFHGGLLGCMGEQLPQEAPLPHFPRMPWAHIDVVLPHHVMVRHG